MLANSSRFAARAVSMLPPERQPSAVVGRAIRVAADRVLSGTFGGIGQIRLAGPGSMPFRDARVPRAS